MFTVSVSEIERQDQHRTWPISSDWLNDALQSSEARATPIAGQLTVHIFKNGQDFVTRGSIRVQVELPCARTLDPAVYDLRPELFLVLRRREVVGEKGRRERAKSPKQKQKEDDERLLTDEDAASDTFSGDAIALDEFVREQILLELPMFPLRSDLRSEQGPAIPPPPQSAIEEGPVDEKTVDPRLAPLMELKAKLKKQS